MSLPRKIMQNEKTWELKPEFWSFLEFMGWAVEKEFQGVWEEVAEEVEIEFEKSDLPKAKKEKNFKKKEW